MGSGEVDLVDSTDIAVLFPLESWHEHEMTELSTATSLYKSWLFNNRKISGWSISSFSFYDASSNVKAILHNIDALCRQRSCVTASFQTFFFFHIYCQEAASADSSAFWVESLDCTGGKVSSQSNPLQWSNNKSKKLQSCEAEIINHLIYGDNAEWENSKHKQTLSRCWGKLHGTGDTGS